MKKSPISHKQHERGVTLLEIIFVIAIAGAIALVVIQNFATGQAQQRIQTEVNNLNTLVTLVRSTFTSQGNYNGLANAVVTASGSFPDSMRVPGQAGQIKHSWATDGIILAPADIDATDDGFTVTYQGNIPQGVCVDFVNRVFSYFTEVTVNSVVVTNVAGVNTNCADNVPIVLTSR